MAISVGFGRDRAAESGTFSTMVTTGKYTPIARRLRTMVVVVVVEALSVFCCGLVVSSENTRAASSSLYWFLSVPVQLCHAWQRLDRDSVAQSSAGLHGGLPQLTANLGE